MHRVADLRRMQAAATLAVAGRPRCRLHAGDALGVVAVGAALEEGEGAVGEPREPVTGRLGEGRELAQARRGRRQRLARALEEGELALLGDGDGGGLALRRLGRRLRASAVEAQDDRGLPAVELERHRRVARPRLLVEAQPGERPADRRLVAAVAGRADRAGDDEPLHRTGHRDVVEAEPLRLLRAVAVLLHVAVGLGPDPRPRRRVGDLEAEPAVGEREDVRDGRPAPSRIGDDDNLELEPLGGVDRE